MTPRYLLSPRAKDDLEAIWDYSAERWGEDRAEAYVRAIWDAVKAVAEHPRRGRRCDDIRAGYWKHSVGSHVLFYTRLTDGVNVVRILHQRMDFDQHL